ncbi:hypothetical protein RB599_010757 [Gaeumannomyces hyphopodioides]
MASPVRHFGTVLNANRGSGCELSQAQRGAIITSVNAGQSYRATARAINVSYGAVHRTMQRFKTDPGIKYNQLLSDSPVRVSKSTIRRALPNEYQRKWRKAKRILLSPECAAGRLSWAKSWREKDQQLVEGSYSDECTVQNLPNLGGDGWVFRAPWDKYRRYMIEPEVHVHATLSSMCFGRIWKGGRSPLVIMNRDPTSARNGYTTKSYLEALEESGLAKDLDEHPKRFFQQDNARIHTSKAAIAWLEGRGIQPILWPTHSPDMNPIEHVWKKMKETLRRDAPDLHKLGSSEADQARFEAALKSAWDAVPQAFIDGLIDSVPRRVAALRAAGGWYTKY